MVRLTPEQIQNKVNFVRDYIKASNAANGSTLDANANVSNKNIATLSAELNKDINIQLNRAMIKERIAKRFGQELADEYERQLEAHEIYTHDETSILPYCASITMYPFLTDGLKAFGGETKAPKHLSSFNGGLINLVFAVSSQLAGANAIVEYLMYFDYFARKDYGEDYLETHPTQIAQEFQQFIYAINQPAAARGFQSAFTNISIYDRPYFEAIFGDFVFPDFTKPSYESLAKLQKFFMHWFNEERKKALLTFPVITAACLNDGNTLKDKDFQDFITKEYSEGNAFFTYTSSSASALSSCCFNGDELINIHDNDSKTDKQIKISEFVEQINKEPNADKILERYFIKSLNPETLEIENTVITGILKKINTYKSLVVINVGNDEIKVTPDHKFLVKDKLDGSVKEIDALSLSKDYERYMVPCYA